MMASIKKKKTNIKMLIIHNTISNPEVNSRRHLVYEKKTFFVLCIRCSKILPAVEFCRDSAKLVQARLCIRCSKI